MSLNVTSAPLSETLELRLDDLPVGSLRLVRVQGRKLCLVRTSDGLSALDHACPHEGYGLTQGQLDGDVLTCAWHNWKFRVSDGECVLGEEAVTAHDVDVDEAGRITVTLHQPDPEALRIRLRESLRSAIERNYIGQTSRDVVRLLQADANPGELVWEAVAYGAPRAEFGWGHSIASATDCLAMLDLYDGDQRALPMVQAIAGTAETERGRPVNELPAPSRSLPDRRRCGVPGRRRGRAARARRRRCCGGRSTPGVRRPSCPPGSPGSSAITCCRTATARSMPRRRSSCSTCSAGSGRTPCCRTSCRRSSTEPARTRSRTRGRS